MSGFSGALSCSVFLLASGDSLAFSFWEFLSLSALLLLFGVFSVLLELVTIVLSSDTEKQKSTSAVGKVFGGTNTFNPSDVMKNPDGGTFNCTLLIFNCNGLLGVIFFTTAGGNVSNWPFFGAHTALVLITVWTVLAFADSLPTSALVDTIFDDAADTVMELDWDDIDEVVTVDLVLVTTAVSNVWGRGMGVTGNGEKDAGWPGWFILTGGPIGTSLRPELVCRILLLATEFITGKWMIDGMLDFPAVAALFGNTLLPATPVYNGDVRVRDGNDLGIKGCPGLIVFTLNNDGDDDAILK